MKQYVHTAVQSSAVRISGLACLLVLALTGCVVQHGVDFGHWAKTAERKSLVKVRINPAFRFRGTETIAFLPVSSDMPEETAARLRRQLTASLEDYIPFQIRLVDPDNTSRPYLDPGNLMTSANTLNLQEVARAGRIYGSSFVLYLHVTDYHPYPPQRLSWQLWLVGSTVAQQIVQAEATFDAAEQQTVLALADHLQSRRARKFDYRNLDVMLQSPVEYERFASAYCARQLAGRLFRANMVALPAGAAPKIVKEQL